MTGNYTVHVTCTCFVCRKQIHLDVELTKLTKSLQAENQPMCCVSCAARYSWVAGPMYLPKPTRYRKCPLCGLVREQVEEAGVWVDSNTPCSCKFLHEQKIQGEGEFSHA